MSLWFRSDWINPFSGQHYNWIDFTAVHLSGELDNRFGNIEFHVALLGLHVGGQWKVAKGDVELQRRLDEMVAGVGSGEVRISITLSEYNDLRGRAGEALNPISQDEGGE